MENTIIVVAAMGNLTDSEFVNEIDLKQQAMTENSTIVPNISPTAAEVKTKGLAMLNDMKARDLMVSEIKQKTSDIESQRKDLTNIMTSQWAYKIQEAVEGDEGKVELLRFKVKGKSPSMSPDPECAPLISKIDINVAGQHTLNLIDSQANKRCLPKGILRIDIYGQTGGTAPANLSELITNGGGYLGQATKSKFVNTFTGQKTGTIEYYIAVYVSKKTKKPFSQGKMASAVITM